MLFSVFAESNTYIFKDFFLLLLNNYPILPILATHKQNGLDDLDSIVVWYVNVEESIIDNLFG